MTDPSPFEVLGLAESAGVDDVLGARRRLAKRIHPDIGGDAAEMQRINAAAGAALRILAQRRSSGRTDESRPPTPSTVAPERTMPTDSRRSDGGRWQVVEDHPCFTIDALPVVAHAGLVVVAEAIGTVLVDESPYLLEAMIDEGRSWCRLEIVPDAGSSSVGLTVSAVDPDLDATRDMWVARLNALDWSGLV